MFLNNNVHYLPSCLITDFLQQAQTENVVVYFSLKLKIACCHISKYISAIVLSQKAQVFFKNYL